MSDLDQTRIDAAVLHAGRMNDMAFQVAARTVTHTLAATRLGIPKQTQSDWIREHHKRATQVYAAYGLKLVPVTDRNYSDEDIAAITHLARKGVDALKPMRKAGGIVVDLEVGDTALGEIDA